MSLEIANQYSKLVTERRHAFNDAAKWYRQRNNSGNNMQTYSFAYEAYRTADENLFCFMAFHSITEIDK